MEGGERNHTLFIFISVLVSIIKQLEIRLIYIVLPFLLESNLLYPSNKKVYIIVLIV